MELIKEIEKMKEDLIKLANTKTEPLKDLEIYEQNCAIDKKIVEFLKLSKKNKESIDS